LIYNDAILVLGHIDSKQRDREMISKLRKPNLNLHHMQLKK